MELRNDLVAWIESTMSGEVVTTRRLFGGGSRITWLVDLRRESEIVPLVLRVESGAGVFSDTVVSLGREATVYRALHGRGVRIPLLHGVANAGEALLMDRAIGTSSLHRLAFPAALNALGDFVDVLADLHALPISSLDLPGIAIPVTAHDHATLELDFWYALSERCTSLDAEIGHGFEWLRRNAPELVARTSFLQGDTGPGNFVVDGERVSAVIDWEFAHFGDPADDLAWLTFRTRRVPGITAHDQAALVERYQNRAGYAVNPASIAYYLVMVNLRCALTTAMTLARGGGALSLDGYREAHRNFVSGIDEAIAAYG